MRIYFNTSALNRPLDDQSSERVRLEAEAVTTLLSSVERGAVEWVCSDYLRYEVDQNPDRERAERVRSLLVAARKQVPTDPAIVARALELERHGYRGLDALHIAAAESGGADLLVTTDDRMLRRAARAGAAINLKVLGPVEAARIVDEAK